MRHGRKLNGNTFPPERKPSLLDPLFFLSKLPTFQKAEMKSGFRGRLGSRLWHKSVPQLTSFILIHAFNLICASSFVISPSTICFLQFVHVLNGLTSTPVTCFDPLTCLHYVCLNILTMHASHHQIIVQLHQRSRLLPLSCSAHLHQAWKKDNTSFSWAAASLRQICWMHLQIGFSGLVSFPKSKMKCTGARK